MIYPFQRNQCSLKKTRVFCRHFTYFKILMQYFYRIKQYHNGASPGKNHGTQRTQLSFHLHTTPSVSLAIRQISRKMYISSWSWSWLLSRRGGSLPDYDVVSRLLVDLQDRFGFGGICLTHRGDKLPQVERLKEKVEFWQSWKKDFCLHFPHSCYVSLEDWYLCFSLEELTYK